MILKKVEITNCIIFLAGFFSFASGFYLKFGSLNLRFYDIFFIPLIIFSLFSIKQIYFTRKELNGIIWVLVLFLWLTLNGAINVLNANPIYSLFIKKYFINKILWILFYVYIYLRFKERLIYFFFLGLSFGLVFNAIMVIGEFITIFHGSIPKYQALNSIGIFVDEKKGMIINQNMIRPTGLTLDPNYAGGYGGIGIIYGEYLKIKKKWNANLIFAFQLIITISIVIIFSRTGLFSLILVYLFTCFLYIFYHKQKQYKPVATNLFIFLIAGIIFSLLYIYNIDNNYFELLYNRLNAKDSSASTRIDYLLAYISTSNVKEALFGVGTNLSGFWLGKSYSFSNGFTEIWSPESNFITFYIEQGIIFILFLIASIWIYIKKLLRIEYFLALILLYINLIGLSYNFLGDRIYYFITTILILYSYKKNNHEDSID